MTSNLHLARLVRCRCYEVVPIDIQRINAMLTFDGATGWGGGEGTPEFTTDPQNGSPIFELRRGEGKLAESQPATTGQRPIVRSQTGAVL